MRIVDTVIAREGDNSIWANVVFVGDGGETVSVRLACPSSGSGEMGRSRIIERAMKLLQGLLAAELPDRFPRSAQVQRFGVTEQTGSNDERWRGNSSGEE
ncbi:hypothetical protein [Chelativorans sp. M5D2P16]|uniref:hypothetical protein n=1 Tax=Chelativorans sp. M5D2P16 TaxID=3095678 RepID=UPI002ACA9464|nr:hypothetical protein [Chelativorans sp. M5D2P16]MDZ5697009.1 hypothetical protein [Chelativorans sp. M5D2P16]